MQKISVLLPAYNHENYIRNTVLSILNQAVEDIEVIAVDDGSTDATGRILDDLSLTDARLKVFHKVNGGLASALNYAIDEASGEWIATCGSDDLVPGRAYKKLLSLGKNADVVIGGFCEIDDLSRRTRVRRDRCKGEKNCFSSLFWMPATWNKLIRQRFIQEHGLRFRDVKICEDLILMAELAAAGPRCAVTDTPVYLYRNDASNYSSMTHIYSAYWLKAHIDGRREVLNICKAAEIPEGRAYVYGASMAYLARCIEKLTGAELAEGLAELQRFAAEGRDQIDEPLFKARFSMSLDAFLNCSAESYAAHMQCLTPEEKMLNKYAAGDIGLQFALRCIRQWVKHKFQ